jgi:hypothetical protein
LAQEKVKSHKQNNILRQIRDVEKEILALLKAQKTEMERQNRNMERAIQIIEQRKQQKE